MRAAFCTFFHCNRPLRLCRRGSYVCCSINGFFCLRGRSVFFFASGIYWKPTTFGKTMHKLSRIAIPWFFWGTAVYGIACLSGTAFSLGSYLLWIVGHGSYLWYMTVFCFLQIIFCFLPLQKKGVAAAVLVVSLISRITTATLGLSGPVAFLNPLNWAGFYAFGILARQTFLTFPFIADLSTLPRPKKCLMQSVALISSIAVILLSAFGDALLNRKIGYWSTFCVFAQIGWIFLLLWAGRLLSHVYSGNIGKASLAVYLAHIPFIGYITNRFSLGPIGNLLFSVLIVFALYTFLWLCRFIAEKGNFQNPFCQIIGFPKK